MNINQMTNEEIRQKGIEALSNALGAAGVVRFLRLFGHGSGDWTEERSTVLRDDVSTVVDRIRRRTQGSQGGNPGG